MLKYRKNKIIILTISLSLIVLSIYSSMGYATPPKLSNPSPMENVVIDGIIGEAEWSDADNKSEFFLDIDDVGNPPDSDGYNYLYLGEDLDNLYIGLDLASDQTGDITDEWVGIWLSTNNQSFTNFTVWEQLLNNGTESLIHDVENDDVFPFFSNNILSWGVDFNSDDEFNVVTGGLSGDYTLFDSGPGDYLNFTSAPVLTDYQIWVDFSIDLKSWFTSFPAIFASAVQNVRFRFATRVNTAIADQKIILWYSNGTHNKDDPHQVIEINDNTSWLTESFIYNVGNLTADHKMQFSLYGNHSAPFMTQFDYFEFDLYINQTNTHGGAVISPFSSINNYQIEWGFGASPNNVSNHRMFEIQIPKIELEHYDPNSVLGIIVGGYGTMVFPGTNYWTFGAYKDSIRQQNSANYNYYNMNGCSIPQVNGNGVIPSFDLFLIIGIASIITVFLLKKHKNNFKF
jgi:hypothetical protein